MVSINKDRCVGCGMCANICPEGIEMLGGKARIKDENAKCIKDAADICPKKAIIFDEEENIDDENTNSNYNPGMGQVRGMGAGRGKGLGRGPRDGRGGCGRRW